MNAERGGARLSGVPGRRRDPDRAAHVSLRAPAAGAFTARMFREGGLPHQLLVVTDLTRALREEELQAWQRLVRVLGHELNNSLAPIKSIAGSLEALVQREPLAEDWRDDAVRGLSIIASRSERLSRFMGAYARLAKLPRPHLAPHGRRRLDPPGREPGAASRRRWSGPALRWRFRAIAISSISC